MVKYMNLLRVSHFLPSYLPISETFIYRYLSNFSEVHPTVFSGKFENIELFPLNDFVDCSWKRYSSKWIVDNIGRRIFGVDDLFLKFILKKKKISLIHAHFGPIGHGLLDIRRSLNLPLVTTFYGYDMSSLPHDPVWKTRYDELFAEGDLFLVEGNHMKKELVALGCPEDKVRIQHIAIDTAQFSFNERNPKENGEEIVLFFCGRFTEKKGLIYALMAFKEALAAFPSLRLRMVGDGELRPQIEEYVATNGLAANVDLLGYQPHHVVADEMSRADILIQPSVTASNGGTEGGAPTIILEAQAAGVPVLATYHADIPEVVRDGETALLSAERDWEGLADNLLYLLHHQQLWGDFGRSGRIYVEKEYDIRHEVVRLEAIYKKLISRHE